ncbi:rarD protein [Pseudonocardia oroxyli]|uniref:RarD protein n=1 Tax=Pseudonocardia oroxyli TaxID=366584 RepID=A0A1G7G6A9_PSEOR|nr:EamA family transporter [Pseudonocardia oroxyli]SDE83559.1 rarD protein [Pseudonocardia oroxyli]
MLWGLFPAFWPLLDPAAPVEVLAHRILWTMVLMAGVLALTRGWGALRRLSAGGWARVAVAACLITVNWGVFIYGVAVDRVVDIALGYYISPLVSTLLAITVLRERPNRAQVAALLIAAAAVVVISIGSRARRDHAHVPVDRLRPGLGGPADLHGGPAAQHPDPLHSERRVRSPGVNEHAARRGARSRGGQPVRSMV